MKEIDEFITHISLDLNFSKNTAKSYKKDIEDFYEFIFNQGIDIVDLDVQIIRNYLSKLLEEGKTKVTCCRKLSCLRHYFDYLVRTGVVKKNLFIFVHSPKKEIRYPEALYLEQVEALINKNKEMKNSYKVMKKFLKFVQN